MIDTTLELGLPEPLETYSSSAHFFEALDIPTDASGRMVAAVRVESEPKRVRTDRPDRPVTKSEPVKKAPRETSTRVRTRTKRVSEN
jgi:hypothetical protein